MQKIHLIRLTWLTAGISYAFAAASSCDVLDLYSGVPGQQVTMDNASRTWPEGPEYFANWGDKDGMLNPYIRLSGQMNVTQDWKGVFSFGTGLTAQGGNLQMQAHSVVPVDLAVAVVTASGESASRITHLVANQTANLDIPLSELGVVVPAQILGVAVKLVQVPTNQNTTVFFDQFRLTCANREADVPSEPESNPVQELAANYPFITVDPLSPARMSDSASYTPGYAYVIKSDSALTYQRTMSTTKLVLSAAEHYELNASFALVPASAQASVDLWKNNLHVLSRARLADSVFANPATLAQRADFVAADANHQLVPLLIADINYEAMLYDGGGDSAHSDTAISSCAGVAFVADRYSHVALPVARVNGSRVAFVYDPQYLVTNRSEGLPVIDVLIANQWVSLNPQSVQVLEFPQAGVNSVRFRLNRGGRISENVVLVEVQ